MSMPKKLEELFRVTPVQESFKINSCWMREAASNVNAHHYRVDNYNDFLMDGVSDYKFRDAFKKSILNKKTKIALLEKARESISEEFFGSDYDEIKKRVLYEDFNHKQAFVSFKGGLQLLSKAVVSIALIDAFRQNNGLNTGAHLKTGIRPVMFSLSGFTRKYFKDNISSDKSVFTQLKHQTNQHDKFFIGFKIYWKGTAFYKELSKGKCCT